MNNSDYIGTNYVPDCEMIDTSKSDIFSKQDSLAFMDYLIDYANNFPSLSREREMTLAKTILNSENENEKASAKEELQNSHLKLVIKMAKKFTNDYGGFYTTQRDCPDFSDLIQAGSVGLLVAINKFDPFTGIEKAKATAKRNIVDKEKLKIELEKIDRYAGRLASYASSYIRAEMLDAFRIYKSIPLSKKDNELYNVLESIEKNYLDNYGRLPNDIEILKSIKRKDGVSEYEYAFNNIRKDNDNRYRPSCEEIIKDRYSLLERIHSLMLWSKELLSLEASYSEDGRNLNEILGLPEDIEGMNEYGMSTFMYDLNAIELMILRLENFNYNNEFISIDKINEVAKIPPKGSEEYKSILNRAKRKIVSATVQKESSQKTAINIDEYEMSRHMKIIAENMNNSFGRMISQEEVINRYEVMKAAREAGISSEPFKRSELIKCIRNSGLDINQYADDSEIQKCILMIPTKDELIAKIVETLFDIYEEFPTSEAYLRRIIDNLGCEYINKSYTDNPDSIRVSIVKQFLYATDYGISETSVPKRIRKLNPSLKDYDDKAPEIIMAVTEELFADFDKMQDNKQKKRWKLLRLADDFEKGIFKTNYVTKNNLYIFAFAFGMKAFESKADYDYNPIVDIEKNLFEDYYNNDYTKYLLDMDKMKYEWEITGEGINYKNFAELIYIYYLNYDNYGLSAGDRLNRAEDMIESCFDTVKANKKLTENSDSDVNTRIYKNKFWEMRDTSEEEFKDFILNTCVIPKKVEYNSKLFAAANSITALEKTEGFLSQIEKSHYDKLKVNDCSLLYKKIEELLNFQSFFKNNPKKDEFLRLIKEMNGLMSHSRLNTNANGYKQTRSRLILAAYYAYQLVENPTNYSFSEIFDSFASFVNDDLIDSRYQELSTKNIFDVYLVFVIYFFYNVL